MIRYQRKRQAKFRETKIQFREVKRETNENVSIDTINEIAEAVARRQARTEIKYGIREAMRDSSL